jgi:hypothetical protein
MSIVVRFAPKNVTLAQYDQSLAKLTEALGENFGESFEGCQAHVAFKGSDGSLYVSEIWDSKEQFEAFGEELMPILADLGIDPGEPEIFEVHNLQLR